MVKEKEKKYSREIQYRIFFYYEKGNNLKGKKGTLYFSFSWLFFDLLVKRDFSNPLSTRQKKGLVCTVFYFCFLLAIKGMRISNGVQ